MAASSNWTIRKSKKNRLYFEFDAIFAIPPAITSPIAQKPGKKTRCEVLCGTPEILQSDLT